MITTIKYGCGITGYTIWSMEVEGEYQQTKFIFEVPKIGFFGEGTFEFSFFLWQELEKKISHRLTDSLAAIVYKVSLS